MSGRKRQVSPRRNSNVTFIPQERMQELRNLNGRGFTYDNAQGIYDALTMNSKYII